MPTMNLLNIPREEWEASCLQLVKLLKDGAPLSLRGAVMAAQLFAKRYIIAQNSVNTLAVYSDLGALENLILYFNFATLTVLPPMVKAAQARDPNDVQSMRSIFTHGLLMLGALGTLTSTVCLIAPALYEITEQPTETIDTSRMYFLLGIVSYIPDLFYRLHVRVMIGFEDYYSPLLFDSFEAALDIACTYLFVQKPFNWGVNGCALAYSLAAILTCFSYHFYLRKNPEFEKCKPYFSSQDISKKELITLLKHGFSTGFTEASNYFAQIIATLMCGISGRSALIGMQAAGVISLVISLPLNGLGSAVSVLISDYWTQKNERYRVVALMSLGVSLCYSLSAFIVIYMTSNELAGLFFSEKDAVTLDTKQIARFIWIQALMEVVNTIIAITAAILVGCLETRFFIPLNLAFILGLNTLSTAVTHSIFSMPPEVSYASQLLGSCANAVGLLYLCKRTMFAPVSLVIDTANEDEQTAQQPITMANNRSGFWARSYLRESPLHNDRHEELPTVVEMMPS